MTLKSHWVNVLVVFIGVTVGFWGKQWVDDYESEKERLRMSHHTKQHCTQIAMLQTEPEKYLVSFLDGEIIEYRNQEQRLELGDIYDQCLHDL
ncbi:hypothetical protein [Vibrio agarivorans]|uniref:DUF2500 domain-containing protein n=1 Tax=Vibrio agarivorans TaxID=153622 RepID=A0ABT7Y4H6_9VIBR|nr:hypothetical protein [Vibrio agarivorans]MDN2482898.1 hypothetical protein [Vibrio agarivorans]